MYIGCETGIGRLDWAEFKMFEVTHGNFFSFLRSSFN